MATKVYRRKRGTTTPAISKLGDDDLLVEVLCRIRDSKTACRCKSVCKRWNSLISAPYFSRRFLSHHHRRIRSAASGESEPPSLLIPSTVWESQILSFLPRPSETRLRASVVDCFKDLLLVEFGDENRFSDSELSRSYVVCNPFTKQWVALPSAPSIGTRSISRTTARLVCEPCNSITALDLGVDGSGEEPFTHHSEYRFLVVRLHYSSSSIDVFCSESGKWTELALDVSIPQWNLDYNVVSLNGTLYWKDHHRRVVVGWNPFSSLDDQISPPLAPTLIDASGVELWAGIWSSEGALHMISPTRWNLLDATLSVWRLEEEEEEEGRSCRWRRRYQVSWHKLHFSNPESFNGSISRVRVVGQHPDKAEVIFLQCEMYCGHKWVLLSCNLEKVEIIERFARETYFINHDSVFHSKITLWPTPIPNYQKLRDSYNGKYTCWRQLKQRQSTSRNERGK